MNRKIYKKDTDFDSKLSSSTDNCNEVSRTMQYLIAEDNDKILEDLLLQDSSLFKCERCGVISSMSGTRFIIKKIKRTDAEITTTELDCISNDQNNEESEISINHPDLKNYTQSKMFTHAFEINHRIECEDKLNGNQSLACKESAFTNRNCAESPIANNISDREVGADAKIKNTFRLNNLKAIKRLFTDFKTTSGNGKWGFNAARSNYSRDDKSSTAARICVDADKEKVLRKISYERKSQINNLLTTDRFKIARKSQDLRGSVKNDDISSAIGTMKYLARGQFTILDKQEDDLLSKLQDRHCIRPVNAGKNQSSVLYGSRDDYPQCQSGFWLFDKSRHPPGITLDEYRHLPFLNNIGGKSYTKIRQNFDTKMNSKSADSCTESMERDSLENCTLLEQRGESDSTTFSSSSAENLIQEWMGSLNRKDDIRDISRGHRLVSSRPSLDIAGRFKAEIADNRRSTIAKKSSGYLRTHNSVTLTRLSPGFRKKMYYLIQKLILSDSGKDLASRRENRFTINTLNSSKLFYSRSADAAFVYPDKSKLHNDITNIWLRYDNNLDRISTKSSESSKNKNRPINKKDNIVDRSTSNQNVDKSEDCIKFSHKHFIAPSSTDKVRESANDSSKKIARRITYKNVMPRNVGDDGKDCAVEIFPIYRKILENSEDMSWDNFREMVEILHPDQKKLWRDVCRTINQEAKRIAQDTDGNTEVCIEISPVIPEDTLKTAGIMTCTREIVFELDMTPKNVESFLNKRPHLTDERLDTHKDAGESIVKSEQTWKTILKQIF